MPGSRQNCGTSRVGMNPHPPIRFNERYQTDGILCDVGIQLNATKVPHDSGPFGYLDSGRRTTSRGRPSKLSEALKQCLKDVLNGFSKEELKTYLLQLLLFNVSPFDLTNNIECEPVNDDEGVREFPNHQCGSSCTSIPEFRNRQPAYKNERSILNNAFVDRCRNREKNPTRGGGQEQELGTSSDLASESDNNKQDPNFIRIMRVLDMLCDLRPLIQQSSFPTQLQGCRAPEKAKFKKPVHLQREAHTNPKPRRRLYQQYAPNEGISNLQWPDEDQQPWLSETSGLAFTTPPYSPTYYDFCQPRIPQETDHCTAAATSSDYPMARSNVNNVVPNADVLVGVNQNLGEHQFTPPLSPSSGQTHPTIPPTRPIPQTQPCPLITPRVSLQNHFLRHNRSMM